MHFLFSSYSYDPSNPEGIPNLLVQHIAIVGISILISLVIAFPLGLLVVRYRALYLPVVTFTGLLYTIPGVALIGILVTIFKLSIVTIIIPLVIYTQLVLIRNIVAGINNVDPLYIEVGRAVGMSRLQVFRRVTLPLALPVIIAGVRIATVTTIGIASLATFVGQGGLGDLIFKSIPVGDNDTILGGAILIALLAVVADLLLLAVQIAFNRGRSAISVA